MSGPLDRQRTRRCGEVGKRRWRHSGEEPGCTGSGDAEVVNVEVDEMHMGVACRERPGDLGGPVCKEVYRPQCEALSGFGAKTGRLGADFNLQ